MSYCDEQENRERTSSQNSVDMGPGYDADMPIGLYTYIQMRLPGWRDKEERWKEENRKLPY